MRAFEKLFCGRGFQSKPFSKSIPSLSPTPLLGPTSNRSAPYGSRFVSLQIVQQRMKSVGNIQKITAAMKMVAASRLKGAQVKMEKSRGLVMPLIRLLGDLPGAH
jgi:F-type H+-transporting ATPase subunit gamma